MVSQAEMQKHVHKSPWIFYLMWCCSQKTEILSSWCIQKKTFKRKFKGKNYNFAQCREMSHTESEISNLRHVCVMDYFSKCKTLDVLSCIIWCTFPYDYTAITLWKPNKKPEWISVQTREQVSKMNLKVWRLNSDESNMRNVLPLWDTNWCCFSDIPTCLFAHIFRYNLINKNYVYCYCRRRNIVFFWLSVQIFHCGNTNMYRLNTVAHRFWPQDLHLVLFCFMSSAGL